MRPKIKAYANGWYTVERTPDQFAEAAQTCGCARLSGAQVRPVRRGLLRVRASEKRRSIALIEAVRDGGWSRGRVDAGDARAVQPGHGDRDRTGAGALRSSWVEEPVPPDNLRRCRRPREQINMPVATGERLHTRADFRELFELQACDIIQPDITHCGGILNTKKIAAWADTYYMLVAPHNVGGPVATAAALHFAACTTNFKIQEHFNDFAEAWVKEAAPGQPEVVDGYFSLPESPVWASNSTSRSSKSHPRANVFFNLYADDWHRRQVQRTTGEAVISPEKTDGV